METKNVCGAKYTSLQLRLWLQQLGLPSNGTKNALLVRLNDVPAEERGECPTEASESSDVTIVENEAENDCAEMEGTSPQVNNDVGVRGNNDCVEANDSNLQKENECNLSNKKAVPENDREQIQRGSDGKMNTRDFVNELLRKELDLIKREKEILRKENEVLKMIAETENKLEKVTTSEKNSTVIASSEKELPKGCSANKSIVSFNVLKEIIPEYDGGIFPEMWISQFRNISKVYDVDENTMKTLLMCKLKGKAQMWLHLNPKLTIDCTEDILQGMEDFFCTKENKLVMRRNFEARKWKYDETFTTYYNEKIMLSSKIGIDDDELIDQLIEGIPDSQLRVQASLQCYSNRTQLLQAFSKIQLKHPRQFQRKDDQANEERVNKFRCFNCNSVGHFAAECQKPKRQMGACYGCGSMDHRVANCPERKSAVQLVTNDEYSV